MLYRQQYQQFVKGAMILTVATFIVKVLSALYRIPYQNIAGDVAFYIYQQVYPIYGLMLVFSTYGFPVIISKLIAERLEKEKKEEIPQILIVSFLFLFLLFSGLFLWLQGHTYEVALFLGDAQLEPLIYVVSFFFLIIPFSSVVRGYFQGYNNMIPTATSQVLEQIIRVAIIIIATLVLIPRKVDLYEVGATAILAGVVGSVVGILSLLFFLFKEKKRFFFKQLNLLTPTTLSIVKAVFFQGLTICVANLVFILMQFVDSVSLYTILVEQGTGTEMSKVIKGVYDRGLPLIQVGSIVATSLSLSLVPIISMAYARKEIHVIQERVALSLKITLYIGLAASVGLMCVAKPVNIMLFENGEGTITLGVLGYSILFGSMSIATATILQGLGSSWLPALHVGIGTGIKLAGNLMLIPILGEVGAAISTIVSLAIIATLNYLAIIYRAELTIFKTIKARAAIGSSCVMGAILVLVSFLEHLLFGSIDRSRTLATCIALINVLIGAGVFFTVLVKYKIFTYQEIAMLTSNSFIRRMFK